MNINAWVEADGRAGTKLNERSFAAGSGQKITQLQNLGHYSSQQQNCCTSSVLLLLRATHQVLAGQSPQPLGCTIWWPTVNATTSIASKRGFFVAPHLSRSKVHNKVQ